MTRRLALLALLATPAAAEVPRVVVDTAPLHSLVAQVMGEVGTPALLIPAGTSPHDFAFRPSQARTLAEADLVIWTGPALAPWLDGALAGPALALLESPGWPVRETEEGPDPHAWLSAEVAATWLGTIAGRLAEADPENGATYLTNAEAAAGALQDLDADIAARLAPLAARPFLLPHDAYGYFTDRYGLTPAGAIGTGHGEAPGPAHLSALRDMARNGDVVCLLEDAETDPAALDLIAEGTEAKRERVDADGVTLEPGPDLYPALIEGLAEALETCLAP